MLLSVVMIAAAIEQVLRLYPARDVVILAILAKRIGGAGSPRRGST